MSFESKAQRRKFYALKNEGKMTQDKIDEWEKDTPKNIPERKHPMKTASAFWKGFSKRAAPKETKEQYLAEASPKHPGNPLKALKWNEQGGVDPRADEDLMSAQNAGLITLPTEVAGASCGTCIHFRPLQSEVGHGFCTHPEVKQDVTENMHCTNWSHPGEHDPAAEALEEAQAAGQIDEAGNPMQPDMGQEGVGGIPGATPPEGQQGLQPSGDGPDPMGAGGGAGMPQDPMQSQMTQAVMQGMMGGQQPGQEGDQAPTAAPPGTGDQQAVAQQPVSEGQAVGQQAVQDFQNTMEGGQEGEPGGEKPTEEGAEAPKEKKETKDKASGKGHTININVGEKKASIDFWRHITG